MIADKYFNYLKHFGKTVTVADLYTDRGAANAIALRHDVDYDLDLALEMSYWEHRNGIRSTYYVLHTADYWQDARLTEKFLQMQDFGHEIGIHLNVISEWFNGVIDDPRQRLVDILAPLREAGVLITGCSAHGDKLCYREQFINYWLFEELRPSDPCVTENGLSAEGIKVDDPKFQIVYPQTHSMTRANGDRLPLWNMSMRDVGLTYHAAHVPSDYYYTDSGGSWTRSPDPITADLSSGRHQVLIHPEYWRGQQRMFFFLSTARCGTKWLTSILDEATPLIARHEYALNHYYDGDAWRYDHKTGAGFVDLQRDKEQVRTLLLDLRTWIEEQKQDYAEVNVYLECFLPLLQEIFPDAEFVHLHRNPADVVRSIINRDWYDTPQDNRHPVVEVEGWSRMCQFEKACWYVRNVNDKLAPVKRKLQFESMVADSATVEELLHSLDVPFYPRLAASVFGNKINANTATDFPGQETWPEAAQKIFSDIFSTRRLHSDQQPAALPTRLFAFLASKIKKFFPKRSSGYVDQEALFSSFTSRAGDRRCVGMVDTDFTNPQTDISRLKGSNVLIQRAAGGMVVLPNSEGNAHLLLGGGEWYECGEKSGWVPTPATYYSGELEIDVQGLGEVRLFMLEYDFEGKQVRKKNIQTIKSDRKRIPFSFRVKPNSARFNLALQMSRQCLPASFCLASFCLREYRWSKE